MRRLRGDDGWATSEYMGSLVVVAALITGLVALGPDIGGAIGRALRAAICSVSGGACPAGTNPGEPTIPCAQGISRGAGNLGVTIGFVDLGNGQGYLVEERSNGVTAVTWFEGGEVGVSGGIGGGVNVSTDDSTVGGGARLEGSAAITAESGETRVFDSREDADAYIQNQLIDAGVSLLPPGVEQAAGVAHDIVDFVTGNDVPEGELESTHAQVGISLEGSLSGAQGPIGGSLELAAQGATRLVTRPDGRRSLIFIVAGQLGGAAGFPALVELTGGEGRRAVVSLDLDADGNPTGLNVQYVTTSDQLGLDIINSADDLGDVLDSLTATAGGSNASERIVDVRLDLTDDATRQAAVDFLAGATGFGDPVSAQAAGEDLLAALHSGSTISIRDYEVDEQEYGIEGDVRVGIGGGAEAGVEIRYSDLVGAWYFDPVAGRFVPWTACTG